MDFGKLFDTLKGPALTLASTLIPGGPAILGAINLMLPDDKKLPETATGADMRTAVNQLPPEQRSSLMEKELDVEIADIEAWADIQESMAKADAAGASTRPRIAVMMAQVVVFVILVFTSVLAIAIFNENTETLKILNDSWATIFAVIATPTALLRAYFGMRTTEKKARYSAMSGNNVSGGLSSIIKAFKG